MDRQLLTEVINALQVDIHVNARNKGFWESKRGLPEALMLIVEELGDALKGDREGIQDRHLPHHSRTAVKLADSIIRILDLAMGLNIPVVEALIEKVYDVNPSRPYLHGKKY